MRSWLCIAFIMALDMCTPCQAQHVGWHSGYSKASSAGEKDGLPVLLHFHAWYCGPCQRMDRDVFSDSEVQKALGQGISAVQIDVTQEPELAARHNASTVPRDVVIYPDGTTATLNVGYLSKSSYLSMLRDIVEKSREKVKKESIVPAPLDPEKTSAEPKPAEGSAGEDNQPATTTLEHTRIIENDAPLLGLEGYCPVRLLSARQWIKGQENITADYREIRYRFSSEADREEFLRTPEAFAPQDLGCDPIALTQDRIAKTGSIRFGVFFDNKLYLFQNDDHREQFKQNPLKYTQIRSALKADQILGTRFQ